jgi:hypothetical protein
MSNYDLFALSIQFTFVIVIMSGVGVEEESIVNHSSVCTLKTQTTQKVKLDFCGGREKVGKSNNFKNELTMFTP